MKKIICLSVLVLMAYVWQAQAQKIVLPKDCVNILNKKYKGWTRAKIASDVKKWFKSEKEAFEPNLIKGDWNGDGAEDFAVLIQTAEKSPDDDGRTIVAFIKSKKTYKDYQLDGDDYISLIKKGTKDYNYETEKNFTHKTDAIFTGLFEKSGTSHIWQNGKFVSVITSD